MSQWQFILPYPPSVNHYWIRCRDGGLRVCPQGERYRSAVAYILKAMKLRHRLTGRLAIYIVCEPPDKRRRDMDNILKATLDALVLGGMVLDDEQFDFISVRRGNITPMGRLGIIIKELNTESEE